VKSGQEEVSQETYEVLLECLEVGVRVMVGNKAKGVRGRVGGWVYV
jgi:hypothetical protein